MPSRGLHILIIKEYYFDTILNKSNKPADYIKQLVNIDKTIKNTNIILIFDIILFRMIY